MASSFQIKRAARGDGSAVLAFELENREYFARFVSDRGDDFFENFPAHHEALLAEQQAGVSAFHLLIDVGGTVVGRVNLYGLDTAVPELGYRIAERVAGRGVATAAVERIVALARDEYGVAVIAAVVSDANGASARVLEKAGFTSAGSAEIKGRPATRYERDLRA